jgi:hypothetical protein
MRYTLTLVIIFILVAFDAIGQVENVPATNPVYDYLLRIETKGILEHFSLSKIPLPKKQIIFALEQARKSDKLLSENEKKILLNFEKEFEIVSVEHSVIIYSQIDTNQLLSKYLFGDYEKSIYHYSEENSNVTVLPLASLELITNNNTKIIPFDNNLLMGTLGFRVSGTLTNNFGYGLQVTNTAMLKGDSSLALIDSKYANSAKFSMLHNDADITESHIAFHKDWFYASIGRETRLFGAGLQQKLIINDLAQSFDAITLAAKFSNFEYMFSHNSLLNIPTSQEEIGFNTVIPPKYFGFHSFTFLPKWGEISFFESIIYSRDLDLAYLNPFSFFKSLEHSERDRDNSGMGITATMRPFKNFQMKGTWFLDDIRFSKIGTGYWSNKTAWNIAAITSIIKNTDFGLEYSRVEPYTFTHFNPQNANTNDTTLFSSYILPNSDRTTLMIQHWFGQRYPIKLNFSYTRHGQNIYEDGKMIFNAGGDPMYSLRWDADTLLDDTTVTFLGGNLIKIFNCEISAGYEIWRGFNIHLLYNLSYSPTADDRISSYLRLLLRFCDF